MVDKAKISPTFVSERNTKFREFRVFQRPARRSSGGECCESMASMCEHRSLGPLVRLTTEANHNQVTDLYHLLEVCCSLAV